MPKDSTPISYFLAKPDILELVSLFERDYLANAEKTIIIWTAGDNVYGMGYSGFNTKFELVAALEVLKVRIINEEG